jgi:hypothetical protein
LDGLNRGQRATPFPISRRKQPEDCVETYSYEKRENGIDTSRHAAQFAPELQRLIDAWPTLPETIRVNILAMIDMDGNG